MKDYGLSVTLTHTSCCYVSHSIPLSRIAMFINLYVLCYDVQILRSHHGKWMPEVTHYCGSDIPVILVGCKQDTRCDSDRIQDLRKTNERIIAREEVRPLYL